MSERTKTHSRGFTLIEMLIVVSLLGMVFLAVYGALSGGVRIWKRLSEDEKTGDLMLARKRWQKDLRGRLNYKAIPLTGRDIEVSFAALIPVEAGEDEDAADAGKTARQEVGRVRYYSDGMRRAVCRERLTYAEVLKGATGTCFPVFAPVASASFEYYGRESEHEGAGAWYPEWRKEFPPLAVRLKVTLEGGIEKQITTLLP